MKEIAGLFGDNYLKIFAGQNKRVATDCVSVEMRAGHLQITGSDRQCSNQLAELFTYKRDNVGDSYRLDLLIGSRDKKFLRDLLG